MDPWTLVIIAVLSGWGGYEMGENVTTDRYAKGTAELNKIISDRNAKIIEIKNKQTAAVDAALRIRDAEYRTIKVQYEATSKELEKVKNENEDWSNTAVPTGVGDWLQSTNH